MGKRKKKRTLEELCANLPVEEHVVDIPEAEQVRMRSLLALPPPLPPDLVALRRSLDERFRRNEALLKAGAKTEAQAAAQRAKLEAVWQRALRASREEQQSRK